MGSGSQVAAGDTSAVQVLAVGDIASCDSRVDERVAAVVAERAGRVALLGDTVYDKGSPWEFANCFDPAWGPMFKRLRPSPGNHEYYTPDAAGYFGYFGAKAGAADSGWYAYDLGTSWRAIALNSNCAAVGGCTADSRQGKWLASQLDAAGDRHVLAYWHVPRYSSGHHGSSLTMKPFFRMLYRARAAIVLNGHDHMYERFAPQNASGDRRRAGVQQFTVGTGGRSLYKYGRSPLPNTQVRDNTTYGVLRLRLRADGYKWRFVAVDGSAVDEGRGRCR